jgi:hypothetical protein
MADEAVAAEVTANVTIVMNSDGVTSGAGTNLAKELSDSLGTDWTSKKVTSNSYKNGTIANHAVFTVTITPAGLVTGVWSAAAAS